MKDQAHNTTAVYVDGIRVEQVDGNEYVQEQEIISRFRQDGKIFFERLIFGHGRVALRFRTRKFQ